MEFFDSFGLGIRFYPKSLFNFCKRNGDFIRQSKIQYQSNLSDVCGNFCVWFLLTRHNKGDIHKTVSYLSSKNLVGNDKLVQSFTSEEFSFPTFSDCKKECKRLCGMKKMPFSEVCYQKGNRCFRIQGKLYEK